MEETINFMEIFKALKRRFWIIIVMMVLAGATSGYISYYKTNPYYDASTQLLVHQSSDGLNLSQIQTNIEVIDTYNAILSSPLILDKVIQELDLNRTAGALDSQIEAESNYNSQVVNINVVDQDPDMAVKIANTVATVFQTEIVNLMNVDNVRVLSKAEPTDFPVPINYNPLRNVIFAIVLGMILGAGLIFVIELFNHSIRSEWDVRKHMGVEVLGNISPMKMRKPPKIKRSYPSDRLGGEEIGY